MAHLEASLKRAAGRGSPERKRGRVLSSAVLLEAGVKLGEPAGRYCNRPS